MFLFMFLFRMTMIHRAETAHRNANELFYLFFMLNLEISLSIVILFDQKNLLAQIANQLLVDKFFVKIMKKLKTPIEKIKNDDDESKTFYQSYRMNSITNLLYLKSKSNFDKLCISKFNQKRILQYAHDKHVHKEVHRIYELLRRSIFISRMRLLVKKYVITCSVCQFFKSSRQFSYEQLNFIEFFKESLSKLNLNFMMTLSLILKNHNAIMSIIDCFSKYIKMISEEETFFVKKWRTLYWQWIFKNWRIFVKLINDRDTKFDFDFWRIVFQLQKALLKMTIAYYLSTDKQIEKSNQFIEIYLRCLLIDNHKMRWNEFLFHIEYALNIVFNAFIEIFSFQVLYKVQSKNSLFMIVQKDLNQEEMKFLKKKRRLRTNVIDVIKLTQVKMTIQFDKKHRLSNLQDKVYVKLVKKDHMKYHVSLSSSLTIKKLKLYFIKRKINFLIYEIDLSFNMKIHFVISIVHLKQVKKNIFNKNSFQKISKSIIMNDHEKYVIKKIVKIEIRDNVSNYIVKWKEYAEKTWKLEKKFQADVFDMIDKFNRSCQDCNHWEISWKRIAKTCYASRDIKC